MTKHYTDGEDLQKQMLAGVNKVADDKRTITTIFKHAVYKKPSIVFDVLKVFAGV